MQCLKARSSSFRWHGFGDAPLSARLRFLVRAFVLLLPLDFLAFKANLHMATWLPDLARASVILWEYTAERVFDHPWLGIGAVSTLSLHDPRAVAEWPDGFILARTTGQHAHDLFLQTWYKLGVVGVILIALAGFAVTLRIGPAAG